MPRHTFWFGLFLIVPVYLISCSNDESESGEETTKQEHTKSVPNCDSLLILPVHEATVILDWGLSDVLTCYPELDSFDIIYGVPLWSQYLPLLVQDSATFRDLLDTITSITELDYYKEYKTRYRSNTLYSEINEGEVLYQTNCKSCHRPVHYWTGPPLQHVRARWKAECPDMINDWVRNWEDVVDSCDYAKERSEISPDHCNRFPFLSDQEIDQILDFMDQASLRD